MDVTTRGASISVVVGATAGGLAVAWLAGAGGPGVLGVPALVAVALGSFAIQWLAFVPAFALRSERFYDLTGSATYLLVTAGATATAAISGTLDMRGVVLALFVAVWAVRLGTFLFRRVVGAGKDGRFDEIKTSWHRFLVAWTLQGLWVVLTSLAALLTILRPTGRPLGLADVAGAALWAAGFGLEVVADRQKARFSADPANRGRFIRSGVWAWSRHPNYAGEILLWTGVFVIGLPGYEGARWLAVLSPIFVFSLLRFVSGVPILERRADERWGGQPDYEAYKAETPLLWPRPPRRR